MRNQSTKHPLLVYIASVGHSGSTLLDIMIGSMQGIFSCGELRYLPWQLHHGMIKHPSILNQNICTCLKPFSSCPVWSKVIQILSDRTLIDFSENPLGYKLCYLRPNTFTRSFSPIRSVARNLSYQILVRNRKLGRLIQRSYTTTTENNWMLLDAILEATSSEVVVDSTKDPLRYIFLSGMSKTKIIVLIRNPYGLAWSYFKRGKDPAKTIQTWVKYYTNIQKAIDNIADPNDYMTIRYEKLCGMTESVMSSIAQFVGARYDSKIKLDTREYHLVAGNPMRYSGEVSVRADYEWEQLLPYSERKRIDQILESAIDNPIICQSIRT